MNPSQESSTPSPYIYPNFLFSSPHSQNSAPSQNIIIMATSHVSVTKTLTVFPKTLNSPKLLELSNLDRQCPLHVYLIFFYKPSSSSSLDSVFTNLKIGLEETLSVWSPAAGRLEPNPANGKLNLRCNNRGAILVQSFTHVEISELGDLSNYNEFFEKLVYKPVLNGNFSEFPLVVAQVRGLSL